MKKFEALNVSSKFAICGLPIRVDTYKTCSFQCQYCFSNSRKICEFEKELQVGDVPSIAKRLNRIFNEGKWKEDNLLDTLISQRITWHCGGMSDPFQPCEQHYHITKDMIDVATEYGITILFSTKSDTVYGCNIDPRYHSFQLSVTNTADRKDIEPNVPPIEKRYQFYKQLKKDGFKVGIRIQPFLPNITTTEIIDMFSDADQITIEGIKIVPQNEEHKQYILNVLGMKQRNFVQMGLLNLKPDIRLELYKPFIEKLEALNIPYSIADNDLHYLGTNKCCCGDRMVAKSTDFNNTAMLWKYGDYDKKQLDDVLCKSGIKDCKCYQLFTSNRTNGCVTVQDFYDERFGDRASPFSPKFLYRNEEEYYEALI